MSVNIFKLKVYSACHVTTLTKQ